MTEEVNPGQASPRALIALGDDHRLSAVGRPGYPRRDWRRHDWFPTAGHLLSWAGLAPGTPTKTPANTEPGLRPCWYDVPGSLTARWIAIAGPTYLAMTVKKKARRTVAASMLTTACQRLKD